jgi:hypothetical protein
MLYYTLFYKANEKITRAVNHLCGNQIGFNLRQVDCIVLHPHVFFLVVAVPIFRRGVLNDEKKANKKRYFYKIIILM